MGQAFVHDPNVRPSFLSSNNVLQVAGEKEIKAQVRIKFRGMDGQPATVIRSLRVSVLAKHKLKLTTLDSTLANFDSNGKVTVINLLTTPSRPRRSST